MRALPEEKRMNAIAYCSMSIAHVKCWNCWVTLNLHALRFVWECVPHVEHSIGGRPRNITHAQRQAHVRAITIGGLNNIGDVRNALREHQHIEACTSWASIGSLKKQKKSLLTVENVRCRLEFAQCDREWTDYSWLALVIFIDETKINQFQFDGRTWYWVR